ncbi:hypothetical protein [Amycolatopsis panacis]|uniref:hypothetical protein n=1 Tax=Amycolatopsis panacis TaxID=2340917 RepID=UPI003898F0BF
MALVTHVNYAERVRPALELAERILSTPALAESYAGGRCPQWTAGGRVSRAYSGNQGQTIWAER